MVAARRRWHAVAAFVSLATLGLAACGGARDSSGETRAAPVEQPRAVGPEAPSAERVSAIPDVSVLDVKSGDEFALASIAPSDRPVLVWFWAPH